MTNKSTNYGSLAKQLVALIEDEVEPITIFSNISSFDIPFFIRGIADLGRGPKILDTRSNLICVVMN